MPPTTPPATTHDHKPAYDWAHRRKPDFYAFGDPVWQRWSLIEAYMAGRAAAIAENEDTAEYKGK